MKRRIYRSSEQLALALSSPHADAKLHLNRVERMKSLASAADSFLKTMKTLFCTGLVCVVLGLLSFLIDIPHAQQQSLQTGTINLEVSRTEERHMPGSVGGVLIATGLGMMVVGCRERKSLDEEEEDEKTSANSHR